MTCGSPQPHAHQHVTLLCPASSPGLNITVCAPLHLNTHGSDWLIHGVLISQANDPHTWHQLFRNIVTNEAILRTIGYTFPRRCMRLSKTFMPTGYFASPRIPQRTPRKLFSAAPTLRAKAMSGELVVVQSNRGEYIVLARALAGQYQPAMTN